MRRKLKFLFALRLIILMYRVIIETASADSFLNISLLRNKRVLFSLQYMEKCIFTAEVVKSLGFIKQVFISKQSEAIPEMVRYL